MLGSFGTAVILELILFNINFQSTAVLDISNLSPKNLKP